MSVLSIGTRTLTTSHPFLSSSRAPYNMTRMIVAILYAFLLGATFIGTSFRRKNVAWEEDEAAAIIGTVFLSLNVIGTMSINMGVRESLCSFVNRSTSSYPNQRWPREFVMYSINTGQAECWGTPLPGLALSLQSCPISFLFLWYLSWSTAWW